MSDLPLWVSWTDSGKRLIKLGEKHPCNAIQPTLALRISI
jgi:hypothetical protein